MGGYRDVLWGWKCRDVQVGTEQRCVRGVCGAKMACCSVPWCAGGIQKMLAGAEVRVWGEGTEVHKCVAEYIDVLGNKEDAGRCRGVYVGWGGCDCAGGYKGFLGLWRLTG